MRKRSEHNRPRFAHALPGPHSQKTAARQKPRFCVARGRPAFVRASGPFGPIVLRGSVLPSQTVVIPRDLCRTVLSSPRRASGSFRGRRLLALPAPAGVAARATDQVVLEGIFRAGPRADSRRRASEEPEGILGSAGGLRIASGESRTVAAAVEDSRLGGPALSSRRAGIRARAGADGAVDGAIPIARGSGVRFVCERACRGASLSGLADLGIRQRRSLATAIPWPVKTPLIRHSLPGRAAHVRPSAM